MADSKPSIIKLVSRSLPRTQETCAELVGVTLERGDKKLLDTVTLTLSKSGTTTVVGPNGAGKSLLLRVMMGLVEPDAGSIRFDSDIGDRCALVFQRPVLLRRSVQENLEHALLTHGEPRKTRRPRLIELLRLGGLAALANQPARMLSGGEQQRLALVRALAMRPRLLLLDEPTASLDPMATVMIESLIKASANDGVKIVLVTHDHGQARRLADDVILLHHGTVIEQAKVTNFFETPSTEVARSFVEGNLIL